jgi:hypothetical protein
VIQTNFIKTFLITLAIYLGLNVITIFLAPGFPLDDIYYVISTLFAPIINTPDIALRGFGLLHLAPDILIALLSILIILVPPFVAVIVGARLGDSGKISFLSWFLTAIISCVVYLILIIFAPGVSPTIGSMWPSLVSFYNLFGAILYFIVPGIINAFFYGCFSFLFSKE